MRVEWAYVACALTGALLGCHPSSGVRAVGPRGAAAQVAGPLAGALRARQRAEAGGAAPTTADVLVAVTLPRLERDSTWLARRLQAPMPPGPLRRFFAARSLESMLARLVGSGDLLAVIDTRRPIAAALVDRPGPKLRPSEQLVLTFGVKDAGGLSRRLARRYGRPRREGDAWRFGASGPIVRLEGARAYVAATASLSSAAAAILAPQLARGERDAIHVEVRSRRLRRRFGPSLAVAWRLAARWHPAGLLALGAPLARSLESWAGRLAQARVARLRIRLGKRLVSVALEADGDQAVAAPAVAGRALLASAGVPFGDGIASAAVARSGAEQLAWLRRALDHVPARMRSQLDRRLDVVSTSLRGPTFGALDGADGKGVTLLWGAPLVGAGSVERALRQLSGMLPRVVVAAWPAMARRGRFAPAFRRRPALVVRRLRLGTEMGHRLTVVPAWQARRDRETSELRGAWRAWLGGDKLEVAYGVVRGAQGSWLAAAAGPRASDKLVALARRAKQGVGATDPTLRWAARVGRRGVTSSWQIALGPCLEALFALAARQGRGAPRWVPILRQVISPRGGRSRVALSGWLQNEPGRWRVHAEVSAEVMGWVSNLAALLFQVGSYGATGPPHR